MAGAKHFTLQILLTAREGFINARIIYGNREKSLNILLLATLLYCILWAASDIRFHGVKRPSIQFVLVAVTCLFAWLPDTLTLILGRQELYNELLGAYDEPPNWATNLSAVMYVVLIMLCIATAANKLSYGALVRNRLALIALATSASMAISSLVLGERIGSNSFALLAVMLACVRIDPKPEEAQRAGAWCIIAIMGLSASLGLSDISLSTQSCRTDKCGPFGDLYHGIWVNSNGLGLTLAIGMAFLFLSTRRRTSKIIGLGVVMMNVIATGSRTSLIAGIVVLVVIASGSINRKTRTASIIQKIGIITGCGIAALPLFFEFPDSSFTDRGYLWKTALDMSIGNFWGHGINGWENLFETTNLLNGSQTYSTHNQILDIFFRGGYVGLVCAFIFLGYVLHQILRRSATGTMNLIVCFTAVISLSMTERPWSFGTLDWLSWTLIVFVFSFNPKTQRHKYSKDGSIPVNQQSIVNHFYRGRVQLAFENKVKLSQDNEGTANSSKRRIPG